MNKHSNRFVRMVMTANGTMLHVQAVKVDKYREGTIGVYPPQLRDGVASIVLDKNEIVYEDNLPELTEEEYYLWYEKSFVTDSVRIGYKIVETT